MTGPGQVKSGGRRFAVHLPFLLVMAVVAVGIITSVLFVAWLIGRLNNLYVRITGTNRLAPIRPAWLKSMRDTGPVHNSVTVVEAVMMSSVMLAALALITWFFLLAGSPLPSQ